MNKNKKVESKDLTSIKKKGVSSESALHELRTTVVPMNINPRGSNCGSPGAGHSKTGSLTELAPEGAEDVAYFDQSGEESSSSDRSQPAIHRWAKDIHHVLHDYEGLQLFKGFLKQESCDQLVDFHFACESLSAMDLSQAGQKDNAVELIVSIYRRLVRASTGRTIQPWLTNDVLLALSDSIRRKHYRQDLYMQAHSQVLDALKMKHQAFVRSDVYIQALQQPYFLDTSSGAASRSHSRNSSSASSVNGDPVRDFDQPNLPTLAEEEHSSDNSSAVLQSFNNLNIDSKGQSSSTVLPDDSNNAPPLPPPRATIPTCSQMAKSIDAGLEYIQSTVRTDESMTQSVSGSLVPAPNKKRRNPAVPPLTATNLTATAVQRHHTAAAALKSSAIMPPNPYHTNYVPQLPPSMRDSAVSSSVMSSEADTHSSVSERARHRQQYQPSSSGNTARKEHHHHKSAGRDQQIKLNREANIKEKFVPRPEPSTSHNRIDPEKNPTEFHNALCAKLEKIKTEQDNAERLNECIRQIADDNNPAANARKAVTDYSQAVMMSTDVVDVDDSILENHMDKIGWNDSAKHSPGTIRSPGLNLLAGRKRSPGSHSPDRRSMGRNQQAQSGLYHHHHPSTSGSLPGTMSKTIKSSNAHKTQTQPPTAARPFAVPLPPTNTARMQYSTSKQRYTNVQSVPSHHRPGMAVSDTSGIESGQSSGTSQVSGLFTTSDESNKKRLGNLTPTPTPNNNSNTMRPSTSKTQHKNKQQECNSLPRRARRSMDYTSQSQSQASSSNTNGSNKVLPIYYSLPNDDVPYLITTYTQPSIQLAQFKHMILKQLPHKKQTYRYFFKCRDFTEQTDVYKEHYEDSSVLPLYDGKLVAKIVPNDS